MFPELAAHKRPLKIWSAASSSGQEPYSIAMSVLETQMKSLVYSVVYTLPQPIYRKLC
ncbi:CheR family methyltransferase [Poseidonibacter lekithochrous]|uniref:CheR family methyltransferase n=1 Tax=Poseidonibacter lekithochrous TaxID=1904463 RepID=UPI0034D1CA34